MAAPILYLSPAAMVRVQVTLMCSRPGCGGERVSEQHTYCAGVDVHVDAPADWTLSPDGWICPRHRVTVEDIG